MKKTALLMVSGAAMLLAAEYYVLKHENINKTMKKIMKNPEKAIDWLKNNM